MDRTKVALLGAVLVLLTQTIDQEHAIEAIDWNTLGLLVEMMIVVRLDLLYRRDDPGRRIAPG